MDAELALSKDELQKKIYFIRDAHVMLDKDLADLYGVKPIRLREQVKRNIKRFPEYFMFQLREEEVGYLLSQNAIPSKKNLGGFLPYAFTEQGVAMLSAVLKSKIAIEVSIQIIHSFVEMRKIFTLHGDLLMKIQQVEQKQIVHEAKTQEKFEAIFSALEEKPLIPKQGIFYDSQIFDAYLFVSKLIRSAKHSIILLDNYVDETVLEHLLKSGKRVGVSILTKNISESLKLDVKKYNAQYEKIHLIQFSLAHDRFLIIDEHDIYHIGASLKDLGKKWFAFAKLDTVSFGLMDRIKKVMQESHLSVSLFS